MLIRCPGGASLLAIKLRAGKNVEVKRCLARLGATKAWPSSEGLLEKWVKWSFPLDSNGVLPDVAQPEGNWVTVEKDRWQRKFQIQAGVTEEVDFNISHLPPEGCNLELAQIKISSEKWWTLCLEAFGQLDTVEANLRLTSAYMNMSEHLPSLPLGNSFSYSEWLRGSEPKA